MQPLSSIFAFFGLGRMIFTLACVAPTLGFGTLNWEAQRIEVTVQPGDKAVTGVFHFVNSGTTPVTINSVYPDCGCTTAELTKQTYAPKEAGEIKAVFTIGDRVGLQEKTIHVTTDDASTATTLVLRVNIPELLTCSARLLMWSTTEALTEKSVIVTGTSPQKIVSLETSSPGSGEAALRIEAIEPGIKYRISVKPASIAKPTSLPLAFTAKFGDDTTRVFTVYVIVR